MINTLTTYQIKCDGCGSIEIVQSLVEAHKLKLPKGWISVPHLARNFFTYSGKHWTKKDYCYEIGCQDMAAAMIAAEKLRTHNEYIKEREQIT